MSTHAPKSTHAPTPADSAAEAAGEGRSRAAPGSRRVRGVPLLLAAGLGAATAGCQMFGGGGGGVLPASDVGPPPSLRSTVPGRQVRASAVDGDGQPLQTQPTRRLDLPRGARTEARAAPAERRVRREDLEGAGDSGSGAGGIAPSLSPGGGVGVGGKF